VDQLLAEPGVFGLAGLGGGDGWHEYEYSRGVK
jgi:hypothetical protein